MPRREVRPLGDRVIVRRDPPPPREGLVVVPEIAKKPQRACTVLTVGPLVRELIPGDRVMTRLGCGREIEWDGENLLVLREEEILGVLG